MSELETSLGYRFENPNLLTQALSHPSLSSEARPAPPDNQRLEFLGDAVLELVTTHYLYQNFPELPEGPMTKLRSSVVSRNALAAAAKRIGLGRHILFSKGEEASGGPTRPSNLADAVEAIIGAVYLDSGLEKARKVVLGLLEVDLQQLDPTDAQGNSKGELQEILQAIVAQAPSYQIISEDGPPHERTFEATVTWLEQVLGKGVGPSKKLAEARAAAHALEKRIWEKDNHVAIGTKAVEAKS